MDESVGSCVCVCSGAFCVLGYLGVFVRVCMSGCMCVCMCVCLFVGAVCACARSECVSV